MAIKQLNIDFAKLAEMSDMRDLILVTAEEKRLNISAVPPPVTVEREKEDVCRYFMRLCKRLDGSYLERQGIDCLFDVEGGWLPGSRCRTAGLLVAALVIDVAARARVRPKDGTITVSLHQTDASWIGKVADCGIYAVRLQPPSLPDIVVRLAQELGAQLHHRASTDGTTTSFMFGTFS